MRLDNFDQPKILQETKSHEIRFRCPCCEKLYQTQSDVFTEANPEFECQNCQRSFVLLSQVNSFGMFETKTNDYSFASCPKCTHLMPVGSKECPSCGVFIEKFQEMVQAESPTLFELNKYWGKVLENFNLDKNHQDFLNQCEKKMALNFAFQKYDELRKTISFDDLCDRYLAQIEVRLEQQFLAKNKIPDLKVIKVSTPRNLFVQWVFAVIGFVGLALLIFNKIRPTFPNLTGLVVSITVLSFGIWILSSQNSPDNNMKL